MYKIGTIVDTYTLLFLFPLYSDSFHTHSTSDTSCMGFLPTPCHSLQHQQGVQFNSIVPGVRIRFHQIRGSQSCLPPFQMPHKSRLPSAPLTFMLSHSVVSDSL